MHQLLETLEFHFTSPHQIHNTLGHMAWGAVLCAIVLFLGYRRGLAVGFAASIGLAREFLWQLPFFDAWHLKPADRSLDVLEWVAGACVLAWLHESTFPAIGRLGRRLWWFVREALFSLSARIMRRVLVPLRPASPAARR